MSHNLCCKKKHAIMDATAVASIMQRLQISSIIVLTL